VELLIIDGYLVAACMGQRTTMYADQLRNDIAAQVTVTAPVKRSTRRRQRFRDSQRLSSASVAAASAIS